MLSSMETREVIEVFDLGDRTLTFEQYKQLVLHAQKKGYCIESVYSQAIVADFGYILHRNLNRSLKEMLGE